MPSPTSLDLERLKTIPIETKVKVLYLYICSRGWNMENLAVEAGLPDPRDVSVVTRCYGFGGINSGAFAGLNAGVEDVRAFVRRYPHGCEYDEKGAVMYQFLCQRLDKRNSTQSFHVDVKSYMVGAGVLVCILIACFLFRSISGNLSSNLFWLLELVLFYGGIVFCIYSLVKRRPKYLLVLGLAMIVAGLGFGCFRSEEWAGGVFRITATGILFGFFTALKERATRS